MGQAVSKSVQVVPVVKRTVYEDNQVVPVSEPKSIWSTSDQLLNELQQAAQTACKDVFPFENLPPELQLAVVRFAMPLTDLRPELPYRSIKIIDGFSRDYASTEDHVSDFEGDAGSVDDASYEDDASGDDTSFGDDASSEDDASSVDYDISEELGRGIYREQQVPASLFRTSKSMSAMSLSILQNDVRLHIDIFTLSIAYHRDKLHDWAITPPFPSHLQLQERPQFRCMRNYQINFMDEEGLLGIEHQRCRDNIKERYRLISDALANNHAIQRLTVTVPCLCCLSESDSNVPPPGSFSHAYAKVLDVLSPLTRIKVAQPVIFTTINVDLPDPFDAYNPSTSCEHFECKELTSNLQQAMGCHDGKELTHEEDAWKRVKALDHGHPGIPKSESVQLLYKLYNRLNMLQRHRGMNAWHDDQMKLLFDDHVEQAEKSMRRDYKLWQKAQAKKRDEESLRRFTEGGTLAKLWSDGVGKEYEDLRMVKHRTREDEKWLLIYGEVLKSLKQENARLTRKWHERNPPLPDFGDSDDDD
ncbi:MAG: hypothetical protein Q9226_008917 [Calogaya cf. arnoldii]